LLAFWRDTTLLPFNSHQFPARRVSTPKGFPDELFVSVRDSATRAADFNHGRLRSTMAKSAPLGPGYLFAQPENAPDGLKDIERKHAGRTEQDDTCEKDSADQEQHNSEGQVHWIHQGWRGLYRQEEIGSTVLSCYESTPEGEYPSSRSWIISCGSGELCRINCTAQPRPVAAGEFNEVHPVQRVRVADIAAAHAEVKKRTAGQNFAIRKPALKLGDDGRLAQGERSPAFRKMIKSAWARNDVRRQARRSHPGAR
jgi:hypothetical protein